MALTTDAIESAKSLLNAGAEKFKNYPGDLSRVPAFNVTLGGKALIMLDEKLISLELTDNRGFNADELTITVDDSQGEVVAHRNRGVLQICRRGANAMCI